jgi:hypothetical protein
MNLCTIFYRLLISLPPLCKRTVSFLCSPSNLLFDLLEDGHLSQTDWLWQIREQFKRGNTDFGLQFQRFQPTVSWVHCCGPDVRQSMMVVGVCGKAAPFREARKQRETGRVQGGDPPKSWTPWSTFSNQVPPSMCPEPPNAKLPAGDQDCRDISDHTVSPFSLGQVITHVALSFTSPMSGDVEIFHTLFDHLCIFFREHVYSDHLPILNQTFSLLNFICIHMFITCHLSFIIYLSINPSSINHLSLSIYLSILSIIYQSIYLSSIIYLSWYWSLVRWIVSKHFLPLFRLSLPCCFLCCVEAS